jgi:hypothetical protein
VVVEAEDQMEVMVSVGMVALEEEAQTEAQVVLQLLYRVDSKHHMKPQLLKETQVVLVLAVAVEAVVEELLWQGKMELVLLLQLMEVTVAMAKLLI